jgi:hypothetical protein
MSKTWTVQYGTTLKIFHQIEKGGINYEIFVGDPREKEKYVNTENAVRQDACCGNPVVTTGCELTELGEKTLEGLL